MPIASAAAGDSPTARTFRPSRVRLRYQMSAITSAHEM